MPRTWCSLHSTFGWIIDQELCHRELFLRRLFLRCGLALLIQPLANLLGLLLLLPSERLLRTGDLGLQQFALQQGLPEELRCFRSCGLQLVLPNSYHNPHCLS